MAKYRVGTLITGCYNLGEFEADSEEEAIEKAFNSIDTDTVPLCWHCSREVGELCLSDKKEDMEAEEIE